LISDSSIVVEPYTGQNLPATSDSPPSPDQRGGAVPSPDQLDGPSYQEVDKEDILQRPHAAPAEQRTATSVIASILAAGYRLSEGAFDKARTYDEKHSVTKRMKQAGASISAKGSELSEKYRLQERTDNLVNGIDEKLGVKSKAKKLSNAIEPKLEYVSQKVNSGVKSLTDNINSWFENKTADPNSMVTKVVTKVQTGLDKVSSTAHSISDQTHQKIDDHRASSSVDDNTTFDEESRGSTTTPSTTTTTTVTTGATPIPAPTPAPDAVLVNIYSEPPKYL